MPFGAPHRHEHLTPDVRYIKHCVPGMGQACVVAIPDNYPRAIHASAVTLSQDTNAYLSALHAAIGRPRPSSPTAAVSCARTGPRPSTPRWA